MKNEKQGNRKHIIELQSSESFESSESSRSNSASINVTIFFSFVSYLHSSR